MIRETSERGSRRSAPNDDAIFCQIQISLQKYLSFLAHFSHQQQQTGNNRQDTCFAHTCTHGLRRHKRALAMVSLPSFPSPFCDGYIHSVVFTHRLVCWVGWFGWPLTGRRSGWSGRSGLFRAFEMSVCLLLETTDAGVRAFRQHSMA